MIDSNNLMLDKACNWLIEHINEYLCEDEGTSWVDIKWLIRDLKKAMEE